MNEINKLAKKRVTLLRELITDIRLKDKSIVVKKISKTEFYQVSNKMFKVILHYDHLGSVIIDSIRSKISK